jgi:ubiquinone/menaquinone biosynthesis C-methylase UbiE
MLEPESHVLDVGCGIGGAARFLAAQFGNRVTGIDLTPEYIEVAKELTRRVGLDENLRFETASALAMPFDDGAFDAAITLHVAMNIPSRAEFYAEIARVVRPGGTLCVYDVMKKNGGDLTFPVPWSETAETSHLITPEATIAAMDDAGFTLNTIDDRTDFAIQFFQRSIAAQATGATPLGIHLLMGENAREKFKNVLDNILSGRIVVMQMVTTRN